MISIISHIILIISFGGIVFLIIKKMPVLAELSLAEKEKPKRKLNFNVSQFKGKLPQKAAKNTKFDEDDDYWEKIVE